MKTIKTKKTKCYWVEVVSLDLRRIDFELLTTKQLDYLLKHYRIVKDKKRGTFCAPRTKFDDLMAYCPFKFVITGSTYEFTGEVEQRRMEKVCRACNQYLSKIIYENE